MVRLFLPPTIAVWALAFAVCPRATQADEFLIIHDRASGDVLLGGDNGNLNREPILTEVQRFAPAPNGRFVARARDGKWYRGDVNSPDRKQEIPRNEIPEDTSSAAIAPDGQTIAWRTTPSNGGKHLLVVRSYGADAWKDLSVISDNYIGAGAWSPSGDKLAYYSGGPGAASKDGFRLMLFDLRQPGVPSKEIAPPSLSTRISPIRPDPPVWSPDGRWISFEARYDREFRHTHYTVSADGTGLRPASGTWSEDGSTRHVLERRDENGQARDVLVTLDANGKEQKRTPLGSVLPDKITVQRISPSAQHLAYAANGEIHVVNLATKQDRILGKASVLSSMLWLTSQAKAASSPAP